MSFKILMPGCTPYSLSLPIPAAEDCDLIGLGYGLDFRKQESGSSNVQSLRISGLKAKHLVLKAKCLVLFLVPKAKFLDPKQTLTVLYL